LDNCHFVSDHPSALDGVKEYYSLPHSAPSRILVSVVFWLVLLDLTNDIPFAPPMDTLAAKDCQLIDIAATMIRFLLTIAVAAAF